MLPARWQKMKEKKNFSSVDNFFRLLSPNISPNIIAARLQEISFSSPSSRAISPKISQVLVEYSLRYRTCKMAQATPTSCHTACVHVGESAVCGKESAVCGKDGAVQVRTAQFAPSSSSQLHRQVNKENQL